MEQLMIKSDLAFKAVFGREKQTCKEALKQLLNTILGIDIATLEYVNPINEKSFGDDKETEFDIRVITDTNEHIDIEMQLFNKAAFKERLVYYSSKLVSGAMKDGEEYSKMKKCIVIAILDFDLLTETDKFHNKFHFKEDSDNIMLTDIVGIEVLEMVKVKEKPVKSMTEIEKWLYYLKNVGDISKATMIEEILKESEAIVMADEILREVSADEHMRAALLSKQKFIIDRKAEITYAEQKGIQKGRQEGKQESMLKFVKNLLDLSMDIETIKKATGLKQEEIEELKKQLQC